jgi:hypothetical protein
MENSAISPTIQSVIEPLYRSKFWMQLIGVMMILSGVITALSIIGIVVAWIPIWAGVVLMQAAGAVHRAYNGGESNEATYAMGKLRTYFTIFGVLMLIYIILFIVGMLFGIGAGMMGMGNV